MTDLFLSGVQGPVLGKTLGISSTKDGLLYGDGCNYFELSANNIFGSDILEANGISSASTVGKPLLTTSSGIVYDFIANSISSSTVVGQPVIGQIHLLGASGISSNASLKKPSLGQIHGLTGNSIASSGTVGKPIAGQTHILIGNGVSSSGVLGKPVFGQKHALVSYDISSSLLMEKPVLSSSGGGYLIPIVMSHMRMQGVS